MDKWKEIWITITRNKSRSILTAFGVFWGIFMLMFMLGTGRGLEKGIFSQLSGFATNSCLVSTDKTTVPYKGFKKGREWNINNSDLNIIRQNMPELEAIAPIVFGKMSDNNVVRDEYAGSFHIKGQTPSYAQMEEVSLRYGRYINDIDIAEKRKVCVLGSNVYEVLFPNRINPIGTYVKVNGIYYRVVGVFEPTVNDGISIGGQRNKSVILPLSTMQQAYQIGDKIHLLGLTTSENISVRNIEEKVKTILRQQHQLSPADKAAIFSMNLEETFKMFQSLQMGISALIWLVGLGTLLAGAIGISNIMLITVRERTKEIGIRRAIGASPMIIARQIILESIVLTTIAGVLGIVFGVAVMQVVAPIMSTKPDSLLGMPEIQFSVALTSLFVIVFIGALAGLMPALRALSIKPIEALSDE